MSQIGYAAAVSSYALAELAAAAELSARTVRFYQATGLLQRPERAGRQVVYTDSHLDRLRQIADLQARGLKLDAIRDMLHASSVGKPPVVALLGPEFASERWLAETSATFTAVGLAEFLGEGSLGLVKDLEDNGYLRRITTPDGPRWQADDLPLLRGALQLAEIGADIALSAQARDMMRRRIRRMAEDFLAMWTAEAGGLYAGDASTAELSLNLDRLRAVAWQSAAHVMAQEIDRVVHRADEIRQGPAL